MDGWIDKWMYEWMDDGYLYRMIDWISVTRKILWKVTAHDIGPWALLSTDICRLFQSEDKTIKKHLYSVIIIIYNHWTQEHLIYLAILYNDTSLIGGIYNMYYNYTKELIITCIVEWFESRLNTRLLLLPESASLFDF